MKRSCISLIILGAVIYTAYSLGFSKGLNNTQVEEPSTPQVTIEEPNTDSSTESQTEIINTDGQKVTHKVEAGETLFLIGLKYDVLWTTIAQANGLDENASLIEGQELVIPINNEGNVTKEESLNIDQGDADNTQKLVSKGELAWRKDPIEVLKRTAPLDYHLKNNDIYSLTEINTDEGRAVVEVNHDEEKYVFELVQPAEKGDNGVWYIQKINKL